MSIHERIGQIDGFWSQQFAWYLNEHRKPLTRATHIIGIPMLIVSAIWALIALDWRIFVVGWIVGWAFQMVGHRIEGNRPAFLKNWRATLLGPLMVFVEIIGFVGIKLDFAEKAKQVVFESADA